MKILGIEKSGPLKVTPIGNRLYKVAEDFGVTIYTDEGILDFFIRAGFVTNFRSGGVAVDPFVDQVGDEDKALWYLIHDLIYTPCAALDMEHPLSRKLGDQLLREGLIYSKMPKWKATAVYCSVRLFGDWAYSQDDALTSSNSKLFTFHWLA